MANKKNNKIKHLSKISDKDIEKVIKLLEQHNFNDVDEAIEFWQTLVDVSLSDDNIISTENSPEIKKAQDLIYDAWETDDSKTRIELAQKALGIYSDCADAYNILAEESETLGEMKEFYSKAIEAGKKSLGEDNFKQMAGAFWGFLETRPYMRAMEGYSNVLWLLNDKKESVNIIKRMLELNPNDNQGMRYFLINKLLFLRRYKEAEDLLEEYEDDFTASWLYSKAYLYFNKPSKKMMADKMLLEAMEFNPFVPLYLFSLRETPEFLPQFIGFGDENEAIEYVNNSLQLWATNENAQKWVEAFYRKNSDKLEAIILAKEKEAEERFKKLKR